MTLTRLAHTIVLAWGWRRILIAFLAGAASALALPPTDVWPIPFVTFPILVWLVDGAAAGRLGGVLAAASAGWWFGFGYFLAGLYWVGHAFLVDAKTFGWLLPFAVIALPAGMAVYTAFGLALARLIWTRGAAAVARACRRAHASGVAARAPLQRLSLEHLWLCADLAALARARCGADRNLGAHLHRGRGLCVAGRARRRPRRHQATLVGPGSRPGRDCGARGLTVRCGSRQRPRAMSRACDLRIMQPNLQQDEKFNYAQKQQVMSRYLALSDRSSGPQSTGMRDVTHLIWPESAFPFFLTREADALAQIAALLPPGTVLITGAIRPPEAAPNVAVTRAYNSIYVIGDDGSILSVYDKVHLVPFGEYLPFQTLLERLGLVQLTKVRGGFIAGDRRRNQRAPGAPNFLPLVCYEIIFPADAVPRSERPGWLYDHIGRYIDWPFVAGSGERPGWLLNLTNDGWFGASAGPYQHFQQARVRAIEEGLPLVRAANTGISAVVGSVRARHQVAAAADRGRARCPAAATDCAHALCPRRGWPARRHDGRCLLAGHAFAPQGAPATVAHIRQAPDA